MKIDRLISITMYLLNRETVNASELAERFEVSTRTIQRDIETLCLAGIPIASTYGAGGGYAVIDGFRLAKQLASVGDDRNIITALKGLLSAYDNGKVSATLEKALAVSQDNGQKVFLDFSIAREREQVNALLRILEESIEGEKPLRIEYTDAQDTVSERTVEPLALSYRWYAWYLFAFCRRRQDYRLFKVARMSGCTPLPGEFSKKHGDVEILMRAAPTPDERKQLRVRVLCKSAARQQALEYLGSHIIQERPGGDFVLELRAPMERMWFSLLLGFGSQVEVIEPDEVRTMLQQRAQEVLSVYGE